MKRILILLSLMIVIAGTVAAQEISTSQPNWTRYTVKGEEFSINLPTQPALTTYALTRREPKEIWERHLGAYVDGVVYTIYSLDDGNPKKALKKRVTASMSNTRWDRDSEQDVTRDGFDGKQFSSTVAPGHTVQLFATKNRYYQFQAVGAPPDDPRVTQFFSSLRLGENVDGIGVTDGPGILWQPVGDPLNMNSDRLYVGKDVTRKVLLVQKIEPQYTEFARLDQVTGTVVLRVVFSAYGSVTNIRTVQALPSGLTEQAISAARKIKFIPAVKDGKFVSMWMQLEYNFNLY